MIDIADKSSKSRKMGDSCHKGLGTDVVILAAGKAPPLKGTATVGSAVNREVGDTPTQDCDSKAGLII